MNSNLATSLTIRMGLALFALVTVYWLWRPAPAEADDPIFSDVCDPDDGTPCQELTSIFAGGNWSRDVALGDLDGNGTMDAFVVQGSGSGPQSNVIWWGDSGGDCANPFNYGLHFCEGNLVGGGDSRGLALADLDGDADLDVYIANGGLTDSNDEVWLNLGGTQGGTAGTFVRTQIITNGVSEAVALADMNNDTYPDAVVAGYPQRIYWNQGDGAFNPISTTTVAANDSVNDIAVADLDNDTRPDIVLAGEGDDFFFDPSQVFWNENSGPLSATITAGPVLTTAPGSNNGLGLGHLNNDAYPDVFIANSGLNKVWLSNGNRTFTAMPDLDSDPMDPNSDNDSNVALADFEGDGDLDAFVTRRTSVSLPNGVWLNDGDGGFTFGADSLGTGTSYAVALADMDSDGDPDAFVANSGPNKVYRNGFEDPVPPGYFVNSGQDLGDHDLEAVVIGDLDGDNDLDAVGTAFFNSHIWVNQGGNQAGTEGVFNQGQTLPNGDALALGDVDGDTDLDLVLVDNLDPTLLYLNQGGIQGGTPGQFANSGQNLGDDHTAVTLGDIDGDIDLDIMLLKSNRNGELWLNQGGDQGGTPGQFQVSGQAFPDLLAREVYLHDLDNDTDLDLFFADAEEAIWLNQGLNSGLFASAGELGFFVYKGDFGDFDNDADPDIFAITDVDSHIYTNQGGAQGGALGTFADGGQSLGAAYRESVNVGDLTGDGIPDALVAGYNNANIWHNDGDGAFTLAQTFAGNKITDAALGDLDGDGDLDAFLATALGGRVWLNGEEGVRPVLTLGPTTVQGASGEPYFHWWNDSNARLALYLTHASTETQNVEVQFSYTITDDRGIFVESDSDANLIDFEVGDTLEFATAFGDKPGGSDEEVWNLYQSTAIIPAENWPMAVDLDLQSPNLSLFGPDSFQIQFHSPNALARNCYLEGLTLMLALAGIIDTSEISVAADPPDLDLFRNLRDNVMADSPQGRYYTHLYHVHSPELLQITAQNSWLISDTLSVLADWTPAIQALVDDQGDTQIINATMVKEVEDLLRAYKALAGPELRAAIEREEAVLDLPSFIDRNMNEALNRVNAREVGEIWLPIILKQ